MINQTVLFDVLDGKEVAELPYPTNGIIRMEYVKEKAASNPREMGAWQCQILMNQNAMFKYLKGDRTFSTLPYLPDDSMHKRATSNLKGNKDCAILINQVAIFKKMTTLAQSSSA